jgi:hypothetical protein
MNSLLYYDPYHHHDPTIINVHTLLKPQRYQQPNYIPHNQHLSYHTPPISTTNIGSLVNQLLQSQEEFKHTLSVFANEVSLLQTTLTPSFNHHQPLTQHQQPYISYTPFNHQSPLSFTPNLQTHNGYEEPIQQPLSSLNNTQHPTITTEPSPFNNHIPHHEPIHTITATSPPSLCGSQNLTHQQAPQNHTRNPYTAAVFAEEQKQHVTEPLKNAVTATTMPSTEKKVMHAVTAKPRQHSHLTFELHDVSIHIFDPGGRFTAAVCPAARRRQFRNITSYGILFPTTAPSPSHHWSVSLLSLVWEPWDRGKINWNTMDFSFRRRQHTF